MPSRLQSKQRFVDRRPVEFADWYERTGFYAHDHDFIELAVITGGSGSQVSAAGRDPLLPGSMALLVPGVWHEYRDGDALAGFDCFFVKELLYHELAWLTDDPVLGALLLRHVDSPFHRRPVVGRLDPARLALATALLREFCRLPGDQAQARRTGILGALATLLGLFADAVRDQVLRAAPPQASAAHKLLTQRALALFSEDLTREWTLDDLAARLGSSRSALNRAFGAVVGRSPMASFAHARMERAAMLLVRSPLAVAEIGARVGICDANYFARRFRAEIDMSASDYRRRFSDPARAPGDPPADPFSRC